MQIFIILALLIAIIAVIFAVQNPATVTVTFLFWSLHGSLALVLLVTLLVGALIILLASLPGMIRRRMSASGQRKKLQALEAERNTLKTRAEEAEKGILDKEKDVKDLEEQLASLSAELEKNRNHPNEPGQPS